MSALNSLVSEAVDVVVHCARTADGVLVTEVVAVEDLQTGRDSTAFTVTELFRRDRPAAPLTWTGNLPVRANRALEMAGYDVRELLGARVAPLPAAAPGGDRPDDPARLPDGGDATAAVAAPMVDRARAAPPRPQPGRTERGLRFGARRR